MTGRHVVLALRVVAASSSFLEPLPCFSTMGRGQEMLDALPDQLGNGFRTARREHLQLFVLVFVELNLRPYHVIMLSLLCIIATTDGPFVAGVMNLHWMAAITVFVLAEKVLPGGERIARGGGRAPRRRGSPGHVLAVEISALAKKKTITIALDPEVDRLLTRAAQERGVSRAEFIRQQLELVLEQYRLHPKPKSAGILRSLAERGDESELFAGRQ